MVEAFGLPPLNRLLRSNPWALERLRPYAGRTVLFTSPPVTVRFSVSETGELAPADAESQPDLTILATPGLLLRIAAGDPAASSNVRVDGDVQLAGALDYVRRNLRWDYEESLSRIVGDVAAQRIAAGARGVDRWARVAALNLARALAEYVTHENPQVASVEALEQFNAEVDRTRDDVERLAKRVELLEHRLSSGKPGK
jgi:ubiquinone biosynthesis protein UbiJ